MNITRCDWCTTNPLYMNYHDTEWGVPLYDNQKLFEFLILEGMQAGLSWLTILKKREAFRLAFLNFDAEKIVRFSTHDIDLLLQNKDIIRNRKKIEAVVNNAEVFLDISKTQEFSGFVWQFVGGVPQENAWKCVEDVPSSTAVSDNMARALKQKGFKFIGTTICYAFMQATGMVNDHLIDCYRYKEINLL